MGSTFGMHPRRLAGLLRSGVGQEPGEEGPHANEVAKEVLAAWLAEPLPASLGAHLTASAEERKVAGAGRAASLGKLLLVRGSNLAVVKAMKQYAKTQAGRLESGPEHAAAIAVYYAAIASALIFHGQRITQHSFASLQESFDMLASKSWVPAELSRHFAEAAAVCAKRPGSSPGRKKQ